jgi:metal-responsive CopG/Arc/MetJ family transcriptional regulator
MGRRRLDRERITVSLPEGMAAELAKAARERSQNRSQLLEELARRFLAERESRRPR